VPDTAATFDDYQAHSPVDLPEIPAEPDMVTLVDLPDRPGLPPEGPSLQSQSGRLNAWRNDGNEALHR